MVTRQTILDEIRRLAQENGGVAPGRDKFSAATGLPISSWSGKYWSKWGDAVKEAGFEPQEMVSRKSSESVLKAYAEIYKYYGRIPSTPEIRLYLNQNGKPISHNALFNHFGSKAKLDSALHEFVRIGKDYDDLLPILKCETPQDEPVGPLLNGVEVGREGYVYLLKSGNYYKIGKSSDIERRIKSIVVSLPEALLHNRRTLRARQLWPHGLARLRTQGARVTEA